MANELKMAIIPAIQRLHALRWSRRCIARELGIDCGTVSRHLKSLQDEPLTLRPRLLDARDANGVRLLKG